MKWQDPPNNRQGRGKYQTRETASALRQRPGKWALVVEDASNASWTTRIKQARTNEFSPAGSFEATSRVKENGKFDIYARYVGEK